VSCGFYRRRRRRRRSNGSPKDAADELPAKWLMVARPRQLTGLRGAGKIRGQAGFGGGFNGFRQRS